jgi:hypothetical protein
MPPPILAIYAVPHDRRPLTSPDAAVREAQDARDEESTRAQAKAFESGLPSAKVVRIPHADHYVFRSNEADAAGDSRIHGRPTVEAGAWMMTPMAVGLRKFRK